MLPIFACSPGWRCHPTRMGDKRKPAGTVEILLDGSDGQGWNDRGRGARVEVQSEGGFYDERERREFVLIADDDGVARKDCRNSMCFGTQSRLRLTDTYVVHLPWFKSYREPLNDWALKELTGHYVNY